MRFTVKQPKQLKSSSQDKKSYIHEPIKLSKFTITCLASVLIQASPSVNNDLIFQNHHVNSPVARANVSPYRSIQQFQQSLNSRVSEQERNLLAQMLYGEAGRGADPFEILHTVLNRVASPLFPNDITTIVTTKGQYVGYRPQNPVTKAYRRIVDIVIEDWEANNYQKIDGCNHYYFVTGIRSICNKFEISPDNQGAWIASPEKKYAKMRHYCDIANEQAKRYSIEEHNKIEKEY